MKCKKCNNIAVEKLSGYCKPCYVAAKEEEYLDNTDINNLGIVKWVKDMLPEYCPNEVPEMHIEIYVHILNLYNPIYKNKMHRLYENINFRGSAKSTLLTMFIPAYLLAHNGKIMKVVKWSNHEEYFETKIQENFIVIASETGSMAEAFISRLRDEWTVNPNLKFFYRMKIIKAMDDLTGEWTKNAFIINGCALLGVGVGMQIRGRIKGYSRVTFLMIDDLYSENNTLTDTTRAKIRRWFGAGAFNSVDDLVGKCVVTGTVVHEDTILVDLMRNKLWKTTTNVLMPIEKFKEFRDKYIEYNADIGHCALPYDSIENEEDRIIAQSNFFDELQKDDNWKLSWGERAGLYFIALKFQEAVLNPDSTLSFFYQEYFHIIVPDDNKRFAPHMFQKLKEWKVINEGGYNWLDSPLTATPIPIRIELGVDTSAGTADGDEGVITIVGRTANNLIIILKQVAGKFGQRDRLKEEKWHQHRMNKVEMDRSKIMKIGWMDELYRQALEYNAEAIKIGHAGEEIANIEATRQFLNSVGLYIPIYGRAQKNDKSKPERIGEHLGPWYESMSVWHAENMDVLEMQLEFLGKTKNDDRADSAEVGVYNIMLPPMMAWGGIEGYSSNKGFRQFVPSMQEKMEATRYFDWKVN